jgi:hypothetical protein
MFTQPSSPRQVNYLVQLEKGEWQEQPRPIRKMKKCAIYTVHMEPSPASSRYVESVNKTQRQREGPEESLTMMIA